MFPSKFFFAADHPYLEGANGRKANNSFKSMPGLTLRSFRNHKNLIPLFTVMGVGVTVVTLFLGRSALKSTDVNWTNWKHGGPSWILRPLGISLLSLREEF